MSTADTRITIYGQLGRSKEAEFSLSDIRKSLESGASKAVQLGKDAIDNQGVVRGSDILRGLGGATIGGALYGATANRRGYETEEEFRRRRWRGALRTALLGGVLGGVAAPVTRYLKGYTNPEIVSETGEVIQEAQEVPGAVDRTLDDIAERKRDQQQAFYDENFGTPTKNFIDDYAVSGLTTVGGVGGAAHGVQASLRNSGVEAAKGLEIAKNSKDFQRNASKLTKIQGDLANIKRPGISDRLAEGRRVSQNYARDLDDWKRYLDADRAAGGKNVAALEAAKPQRPSIRERLLGRGEAAAKYRKDAGSLKAQRNKLIMDQMRLKGNYGAGVMAMPGRVGRSLVRGGAQGGIGAGIGYGLGTFLENLTQGDNLERMGDTSDLVTN